MMRKSLMMLMLAATLALAGCGGHKPVNPGAPAGSSVPPNTTESSGAQGAGAATAAGEGAAGNEDAAGPLEGTLAQRIIYFDFDNSEIKGAGVDVVAAHAKYLAAHPNVHVRLEGHTDERGSREYNIGLGERRAQSVRRSLLLQGAADGQITTVSYGAERPAVAGHDEAAWAKNRRVEIVYLK
jgi:peptidoglycan-associated lipoprotein